MDDRQTGDSMTQAESAASSIRRVLARDAQAMDGLCGLLIDCVNRGGSVGFLAPMQRATAERYWEDVFAALGDHLVLWIAEADGAIVGSVQLSLCQKENAPHRAEVQKLFVLAASRGHG